MRVRHQITRACCPAIQGLRERDLLLPESIDLAMRDHPPGTSDLTAIGGQESASGWLVVPLLVSLIACWGVRAGHAQQPEISQPPMTAALSPAGSVQAGTRPALEPLPESLSVTRAADPWSNPFVPLPRVSAARVQSEPLFLLGQASVSESASSALPERAASWKLLAPNLLQDQKHIWLFPPRVARGRHWKPAVAFLATTVGLIELDPLEAPYFRSTSNFHTLNQAFSTRNTEIGMAAVPATFYAVSLLRHNVYDQHTTMFTAEAVLDSILVDTVMKASFRRLRPSEVPRGANFWDTFTDARGGLFSSQPGFPSGHAITAFSIATIFANRYSRHRWVPWVAYGLAAAVGFSRITLQAHFTSDVFVGAVLGYSISHYVVLQR